MRVACFFVAQQSRCRSVQFFDVGYMQNFAIGP